MQNTLHVVSDERRCSLSEFIIRHTEKKGKRFDVFLKFSFIYTSYNYFLYPPVSFMTEMRLMLIYPRFNALRWYCNIFVDIYNMCWKTPFYETSYIFSFIFSNYPLHFSNHHAILMSSTAKVL